MIKKIVCLLSVFLVGITSNNAYAVPSVKKLGVNTSVTGAKPVVAKTAQKTETKTNNSRIGKVTKLSTVKPVTTKTTTDESRFPAISNVKSFNVGKNIKPSALVNTTIQPSNTGVSEDTFNETVNRIEALETKSENVINDVVETESGRYVTDVVADGNKLNVTKTSLLYAPVREGSGETVTGEAEIWIIK